MGRTNLKIDEEVHEMHNDIRKDLGLTWTEYLKRCTFEDGRDTQENPPSPTWDTEELADAVANAVTSDLRASLPSEVAKELEGRLR